MTLKEFILHTLSEDNPNQFKVSYYSVENPSSPPTNSLIQF